MLAESNVSRLLRRQQCFLVAVADTWCMDAEDASDTGQAGGRSPAQSGVGSWAVGMPIASECAESTKEMFAVLLEALEVNIAFTLKEMSVPGRGPGPRGLTKPDSPCSEPHKEGHQNQLGSRGPNKCVRPKAPCFCSLGGPHVLCSREDWEQLARLVAVESYLAHGPAVGASGHSVLFSQSSR